MPDRIVSQRPPSWGRLLVGSLLVLLFSDTVIEGKFELPQYTLYGNDARAPGIYMSLIGIGILWTYFRAMFAADKIVAILLLLVVLPMIMIPVVATVLGYVPGICVYLLFPFMCLLGHYAAIRHIAPQVSKGRDSTSKSSHQ